MPNRPALASPPAFDDSPAAVPAPSFQPPIEPGLYFPPDGAGNETPLPGKLSPDKAILPKANDANPAAAANPAMTNDSFSSISASLLTNPTNLAVCASIDVLTSSSLSCVAT